MVVVVASVWMKTVWAKTDSYPQRKHFTVYGCQNAKTQLQNIRVGYLKNKIGGFFIGLSGTYSRTETSFVTSSSPVCMLPPDVLFRALPAPKTRDQVTLTFHPFEDPELASGKGNLTGIEVDNAKEQVRSSEKKTGNVTCDFSLSDVLELQMSGYGFISCQGDAAASKLWREWQEEVRMVEEKAARTKTVIIIGVACGTGAVVVAFLAYIMYRICSGGPAPYQSGRRPSNTSGMRTASTT